MSPHQTASKETETSMSNSQPMNTLSVLLEILRSTASSSVQKLEGNFSSYRNYFLEVQLISKTGEVQESYTVVLTFQSKAITGFSFTPVPLQRSEPGVHEVAFTTPYELPASKVQTDATELVSYIKITYKAHSSKTPTAVSTSLGYGYSVPTAIPCKSLKGLNAITGININCTLYPGASPYIIIKNYGTLPVNGQVLLYIPNKVNPTDWMEFDLRLVTKENRLLNLISVSPYQEARFTTNATCIIE